MRKSHKQEKNPKKAALHGREERRADAAALGQQSAKNRVLPAGGRMADVGIPQPGTVFKLCGPVHRSAVSLSVKPAGAAAEFAFCSGSCFFAARFSGVFLSETGYGALFLALWEKKE